MIKNSLEEEITLSNPVHLKPLFNDKSVFKKFLDCSMKRRPGSKAGLFPLEIFDFKGLVFDLGRICNNEGIDTSSDDYKRIYEKCEKIENIYKSYDDANLAVGVYRAVQSVWLKIVPSEDPLTLYEQYWLVSRNYAAHYFWHFSIEKLGIERTFDLAEKIIEMISNDKRSEITNILNNSKSKNNYDNYWDVEKFSARESVYAKMISFIIEASENYIENYPFEWILDSLLPKDLDPQWSVS